MGEDGIAAERALTKEGKNTPTNLHFFQQESKYFLTQLFKKYEISFESKYFLTQLFKNYEILFEIQTEKLEMVDMLAAFQPISPPFIICRKTNSSKWPQHSIQRKK